MSAVLGVIASCAGVVDKVKENQLAQLVGLVPDQPCVLTSREGRRLAGAYLRRPTAALGFDPIFLTGKESRIGLPRNLIFDDSSLRRLRPNEAGDTLEGSRKSVAVERKGFGRSGLLPNVYDLTYTAQKIDYEGPIVVGPSAAGFEIPTTGTITYRGKVSVEVVTQDAEGAPRTLRSDGRFSLAAGYGTKRADFTAEGLGGLPFAGLKWTSLYLCGTRFVSSGQGLVTVLDGDGRSSFPFQAGRDPVPLRSIFESSQFAPDPRPGSPASIGGVFVVQSDVGTITGVFLSNQAGS